jgi:alkanesulfonate monooxygenase SsuD/methylene tetrahydromethanopterin reductase-like flavin-dependent oxidoreductase (luciferase family)
MAEENGDQPLRIALIVNGEGITIQDSVDVAVEAERAGFDSVWHAEDRREPWVPLAAIAAATSRVRVGTAVAIIARPPMFMEQAAANVDEISGGRHVVALGTGPRFRAEDWHNTDWSQPVTRVREYTEAMREMWKAHSGAEISYDGQRINIKDYTRASKPLRERIPIYLGGSGPKMLAMAGEIADGVIFDILTTPLVIDQFTRAALEVGLERSGRRWEQIDRGACIMTAVHEDRSVAMDMVRHQLAYYMQFPQLDELMEMHGVRDDAQAAIEARERRDFVGMIPTITDRMVETFAIVGTPDEVREQLPEWTKRINMPLLFAPTWELSREQIIDNHRAITAAFAN